MSFAASDAQRAKVRDEHCLICWRSPVDPAHLIPKSLAPDPLGDRLRVVPLCREHHIDFDEGDLDLLPYLADFRREIAFAVELVGIVGALEIITNHKWKPEGDNDG